MAEEQALDRVHRLGQTQEVVATRYIVRDSIEEVCTGRYSKSQDIITKIIKYILQTQKTKLDLIQASFGDGTPSRADIIKARLKVCLSFLN